MGNWFGIGDPMTVTTDEHWEGVYVIKTNTMFKIKQS